MAHALWICACITLDDAPVWLIFERDAEGVGWCRVPNRIEPLVLVNAQQSLGGHADPAEVLRWMTGDAQDPWDGGGDGCSETTVLNALGRKIRPG